MISSHGDSTQVAPTPSAPTQLDSLLEGPAYGATEIHVVHAIDVPTMGEQIVSDLKEEVGYQIWGGDPNSPNTPSGKRSIEVSWVGPHGPVATAQLPQNADIDRQLIMAARQHRVGLRYYREDPTLGGSSRRATGELFVPRPPRRIGKLEDQARILDSADRFEVTISRLDRPGFIGRKVKRQKTMPETFHVVQDQTSIHISHEHRKGDVVIDVANADLVGIVNLGATSRLLSTTDDVILPSINHWSGIDTRGLDFTNWAYDRLLTRLGM